MRKLLITIAILLSLGGLAAWLLISRQEMLSGVPTAQDEAMGQAAIVEQDDPGVKVTDENRGKTTTDMSQ